jgi:hypothetical protein
MTPIHIARLEKYYYGTPIYEHPPWAHRLNITQNAAELRLGLALPWDFGLTLDLQVLCHRRRSRLPFATDCSLWQRLEIRKDAIMDAHAALGSSGGCLKMCSLPLSELPRHHGFASFGHSYAASSSESELHPMVHMSLRSP